MSSMNTIRLGTRGSDLARWQTDYVLQLLQTASPYLLADVEIFTTKGDQVLDTPLPLVGGKGLFTAELEAALRNGHIDFAVHSLKDLPTENPLGLVIGANPERANPADVLVSRSDYRLDTLPKGATVGTSSTRRAAQVLNYRPDLKIADVRGNVDTRIRKALDPDGPYDAILLAHAGLERLERLQVVSDVIPSAVMLPAPGQGALAVQCRDEAASLAALAPIHHLATALAVTAERTFLAGLGGGCSVPIAAYALLDGDRLTLRGRVLSLDGRQKIEVESVTTIYDNLNDAANVGTALAQEALSQGAAALLEAVS